MPLELFKGKTGVRLIAREPTDPETTADVVVHGLRTIQVYAPEGLLVHGYPGLSVVLDSLPPALAAKIEAHRKAELEKLLAEYGTVDDGWARLAEQTNSRTKDTEAILAPLRAVSSRKYDTELRRLKRPPILTSIRPGRTVSIFMQAFRANTASLTIGTVERVLV